MALLELAVGRAGRGVVAAVGGKEYPGNFGAVAAEPTASGAAWSPSSMAWLSGPDMISQLKNVAAVAGSSRSQPFIASRLKRAAIEVMARLGPLSHSTCPSSGTARPHR